MSLAGWCDENFPLSGNAGNDLDLKIEPRQPGYADSGPVGIRRLRKDGRFDLHDRRKLIFRIGVKCGDVDQIIKGASCRRQRRRQIVKCEGDLGREIRFRRAVYPAADLTGDKQQIA
nr:MAG TPA_asm: hypothetical protein [Caudoviricetes sp.]